MYADVLVEYGAKALDRTFTYIIPKELKGSIKVGIKVIVPFGNTTINGFVIKIKEISETTNLKEIIEIPKQNFILNEELLSLGKYIKETTLCSLISAYQCMLPSSMKVKTIKSNYQKYQEYLKIINKDKVLDYINNNKKAVKQIELLKRLLNNEKVLKQEYSSLIINKLITLNLISIE